MLCWWDTNDISEGDEDDVFTLANKGWSSWEEGVGRVTAAVKSVTERIMKKTMNMLMMTMKMATRETMEDDTPISINVSQLHLTIQRHPPRRNRPHTERLPHACQHPPDTRQHDQRPRTITRHSPHAFRPRSH